MNRFKFRGWHPKYGMFDFGLDQYSFYVADNTKIPLKTIEVDGYRLIDPTSIPPMDKNIVTYIRMGMDKNGGFNLVHTEINDPDLVIMQYLGDASKDGSGILLCEGDLIKTCSYNSVENTYRIAYLEDRFWPVDIDGDAFHEGWFESWHQFNKVGNIHENPELFQ